MSKNYSFYIPKGKEHIEELFNKLKGKKELGSFLVELIETTMEEFYDNRLERLKEEIKRIEETKLKFKDKETELWNERHNFSLVDFYIGRKLPGELEHGALYDYMMEGYLCNIEDNHLHVVDGLKYVKKKIKEYLREHDLHPEWEHRLDHENI